MKIFCISDNIDVAVGLRLAGINFKIIEEKNLILKQIEELSKNNEYGILALTDNVYKKVEKEVLIIKEQINFPLIIKIPDNMKMEVSK